MEERTTVSERICSLRNLLKDITETYDRNIAGVRSCEDKLLDIQHEIEFYRYDACHGYDCYKRQHDILNERRRMKDENECLERIVKVLSGYKNLVNEVSEALGEARRRADQQHRRVYKLRSGQNGEIMIKQGNIAK